MKAFIMRGAPGSGKSTTASFLSKLHKAVIASADSYMFGPGKWYDPHRLPECHRMCRDDFVRAITDRQPVIVDNTNLRLEDLLFYALHAKEAGYEVTVVDCGSAYTSVHGVPRGKVEALRRQHALEMSNPETNKLFRDLGIKRQIMMSSTDEHVVVIDGEFLPATEKPSQDLAAGA